VTDPADLLAQVARRRAALLEATAAFAIGVWAGGSETRSLFPTLDRAFGTTPPSLIR
jgi:hypothetical protein